MNVITQEQLEAIWAQSSGDMDTACQLLEGLLAEFSTPEHHFNERARCRPILAAMRDAQ